MSTLAILKDVHLKIKEMYCRNHISYIAKMCKIKFLKAKVIISIETINQGNYHQWLPNPLGKKTEKENV